jgi:ribonuclease BN (tRNA processing enzyme)
MARAGRKQPLTIISPPGGQAKLKAAMALFYPGSARLLQSVSVHYLEFRNAALLKSGPLTVLALPVIHTRETLPHGVRLTLNGITVAYSGDTEWTDHLVTLARDADLFICECTFFDTEKKGHLSYKALQQHRQELQCRRLLLTHCDTEMLQHRDEVTEAIAEDKMVLELTGTG